VIQLRRPVGRFAGGRGVNRKHSRDGAANLNDRILGRKAQRLEKLLYRLRLTVNADWVIDASIRRRIIWNPSYLKRPAEDKAALPVRGGLLLFLALLAGRCGSPSSWVFWRLWHKAANFRNRNV
jgi:hypothetical protein